MVLLSKTQVIRATRLVIALMISFTIISYYNIPNGIWVLITNVVVLYDNTTVGGVALKSYLRFAATLLAAIYSAFFIYFFYNNLLIDIIALALGVFIFAYFYMDDKKIYIGILATVTLAIMLLNFNDLEATVLRPFNIGIGIIVSYLTLRFFYPEYARDAVIESMIILLNDLAQMLQVRGPDAKLREIQAKTENIFFANMNKFIRYADEAANETRAVPMFTKYCQSILVHIKRIYRIDSVFTYHLAQHYKNHSLDEQQSINKTITIVTQLATLLATNLKKIDINEFQQLAIDAKTFMQSKLKDDGVLSNNTLFFEVFKELEQLINDLYELNKIRLQYKYY